MHNIWIRLNAVVFFALSVLLGLATFCCFSTHFHETQPVIQTLKLNTVRALRNQGGVDRAVLSFDLKADLSSAWHWNTHQVFVFLVAEYKTDDDRLHEVVIWDRIVMSKEKMILKETNEFVKYPLVARGPDLRGRDVTLKLKWDHMPITGNVYFESNGNSTFSLPSKYKL